MCFGPHTAQVEALVAAVADPAVQRRRPRCDASSVDKFFAARAHRRMLYASRGTMWVRARLAIAEVVVPHQEYDATRAALGLVASDLIDDATWSCLADTALAAIVGLERPGGVLAERCGCGHQLGERFVSMLLDGVGDQQVAGPLALCGCLTAALPTVDAVEVARGLVTSWPAWDWEGLFAVSRRLAQPRQPTDGTGPVCSPAHRSPWAVS